MENRIVLISGGTDGLGKTLAKQLRETHTVIVLGKNYDKTRETSQELSVDARVVDVRDWHATQKTVHEIEQEYGHIDVLVNSAGVWIQGTLVDNSVDHIGMAMDVNLYGSIWMCKSVVPTMIDRHAGLIVNVISEDGMEVKAERSIYCASKWGLRGFTKALQCDLRPHRVRVTGFYPGKMCTDFFEKAGTQRDTSEFLDVHEAAETLAWLIAQPDHVEIPELGVRRI